MDTKLRMCLLFFGYIISNFEIVYAIEVNILHTRGLTELSWATHISNTTVNTRGWRESSDYTDGHRINSVCNIAGNAVDSWLRTPYIPRANAHRLYVEIEFTMRKCDLFPDPTHLQQCKESFTLLYFEAESDFANAMRPTWDQMTYNHIDVIAADQTFLIPSDAVVNKEVRSISVTRNGVYFAFLDQGACVTLMSVRVYHVICSEVVRGFARFPNTTTAANESDLVQTEGECVEHAVMEQTPRFLCTSGGDWRFMSGQCRCGPGYTPESPSSDQRCIACPVGTYKWLTGHESCSPCPQHSEAPQPGAVECQCVSGYYRKHDDDKSMPCTRPPSPPRVLSIATIGTDSVNVTWQPPAELGGRRDLQYRIDVRGPTTDSPTYSFRPRQSGFNSTSVEVLGLRADTQYRVIVYAENGVTSQAPAESDESIYIRTLPSLPSKVDGLAILNLGATSILLVWSAPEGERIEHYQLRYHPRADSQNFTDIETTRTNVTVQSLAQDTEYLFMVRAKTSEGWGLFSDPLIAVTKSTSPDSQVDSVQGSQPVGIIVGAAIAVIVCLLIVIVMIVCFLRRNQYQCNEKGITECDTLAYGNGEVHCHRTVEGSPAFTAPLTMPLFTPPGGAKTYIDPHTYEDPNQAVREFTKEIDASFITIESVIGGGEFGDVCKGRLKIATRGQITVAIKTLKQGASEKNRLDFLTEASIMGQFDDPNVIFLEGVVTKSMPNMIVMEFMERGALDAFLRENDGKFTQLQLVGMMRGIASGMRYLSDMGYIHRDLAARNILVDDNFVCKVADFGLSREIEGDDSSGAYTTKGGKIPVRWTAPEAIAFRKFTSAADVWSYGVVMWEVMSYGERPYWNWSNQDVIKAVDIGFRLPPPMECPESIYTLMLDCWVKERNQRPKFHAIVKVLDKIIRSPEHLHHIAKQRPHEFINPNKPDLTSYNSVEEWLISIKMERYIEYFLCAGYDTMDRVALLQEHQLAPLGVNLAGHHKKIWNSIQTLRAHRMMTLDSQHISNTCLV